MLRPCPPVKGVLSVNKFDADQNDRERIICVQAENQTLLFRWEVIDGCDGAHISAPDEHHGPALPQHVRSDAYWMPVQRAMSMKFSPAPGITTSVGAAVVWHHRIECCAADTCQRCSVDTVSPLIRASGRQDEGLLPVGRRARADAASMRLSAGPHHQSHC